MTYLFFAAIMAVALLRIVITYDIACQWSKNLTSRMKTLPDEMQRNDDVKIVAAIPSWHINAHRTDCQVNFALAYREGNGRTCGDEIEGTWDHTNSLGTSVREMAPGARHETLNDHFSGYNHQKIVGMRESNSFLIFWTSSTITDISNIYVQVQTSSRR
jgi:Kyakuja-Dileera-Zisupton transposase